MRNLLKTLSLLLLLVGLASCNAQKRIWYIQDAQPFTPEQIIQKGQIKIKPLDRITIVVSSRNPELAAPFNSFSSYNSLVGGLHSNYSTNSNANSVQIRTIDENGMLDMPVIGTIEAKGKTRGELATEISNKIKEGGYFNDPSVNIEFADIKIAVIGEVARPGYYDLKRDKVTIFDALAMAGDLTVYGVRTNVAVAREENGIRSIFYLDLTKTDIFDSPAFYLQQNDVVYVKPNKYKAQSGEISQNRSFYISLLSVAVSVATLIITATK